MIVHYAVRAVRFSIAEAKAHKTTRAILPAYVQGGSNIYKVTARAYDRNGNSSNNVQLTITVLPNGQVVDEVGGNGLYG